MRGGDVDDRKSRVDLSGLLGELPSVKPAQQIDVGHQRAVRGDAALEQGHGLFARSGNSRFKTAFSECIFNDALNGIVIFNHENNRLISQRRTPPAAQPKTSRGSRYFVPEKSTKVNLKNLRAG